MDRREFVGLVVGSGTLPLFAGCGSFTESGIDLVVENEGSETHSYRITDENGESPKTSGELAPDESDRVDHFLPYEDYAHHATVVIRVDGTQVHESTVFVSSKRDRMFVDILDAESVEIRPDRLYSPTPPE